MESRLEYKEREAILKLRLELKGGQDGSEARMKARSG